MGDHKSSKSIYKVLLPVITITILLILLLFSVRTCSNISRKNGILEQNLKASNDTLKVLKTKNGELYYEKESYIAECKNLEFINNEMYQTIKELRKEIDAGVSTVVWVRDTIVVYDSVILDRNKESQKFVQSFSDDVLNESIYQRFESSTYSLHTDSVIYSLNIPVEAYFTDDYKIILKSKNPNVSFSDVYSFIDPKIYKDAKKKRWGLGISAGVAPSVSFKGKFSVGCYVGIGISYDLITW